MGERSSKPKTPCMTEEDDMVMSLMALVVANCGTDDRDDITGDVGSHGKKHVAVRMEETNSDWQHW